MNGKTITLVGSIATAIWLLLIAAYVWAKWSCFLTMEPSSLGDFVAGAFGPLALFWLVCGYFQQGLELRQNTEVLNLQVEELKNSVLHQAEMAQASQQQLQLEIERFQEERARDQTMQENATPKLQVVDISQSLSHRGRDLYDVVVYVKNSGDDLDLLERQGLGLAGDLSTQGNLKAMQVLRITAAGMPLLETDKTAVLLKVRNKLGGLYEASIPLVCKNGRYSAEIGSVKKIV